MTTTWEHHADQELPARPLSWFDVYGDLYPFASGWTAEARIARASAPSTIVHVVTTITLSDVAPNYVVNFAQADLTALVAVLGGTVPDEGVAFLVHPYARRTADSKDAKWRPGDPPRLLLRPALVVPAP